MVTLPAKLSAVSSLSRGEASLKTQKPSRLTRATSASGFTLLEILLVLALIGLLAGVLIGGSMAMIAPKDPSADELFWKVVQEARKIALENSREVHLRFEAKEKSFVIESESGATRSFPLSVAFGSDLTVDFLSTQKNGGSAMLLGGVVVETQPLVGGVTFYDDGTCTPFRVQIRGNGGAHVLEIDPWTGAAILAAKDPYAR